ncbi:MAG: hypothetical protein HWD59_02330 [Coxiellaceae bacterium]|nr:MAG: hypothetical protein HWD59_02330 [Coxiellaceae bacterium]
MQDLTTLITNTHEILLNSNKLNQILRDAETAVLDTRDQAAINESTKN